VAEECEGQSGLAADATEPLVDDLLGLADGVRAEVGELAALQVAPYLFDRIEVAAVVREVLAFGGRRPGAARPPATSVAS